ncbi:MAG: 2-amino-4-hydroxy-6-hydroxymethyldihydropteridine diphosphokinase [Spirosomataceae bacterium]
MTKFIIYLGLGTNVGERSENLLKAISLISGNIGEVTKTSPVYKTSAWGVTDQPDFYNQVIEVSTEKLPWNVLDALLAIEHQMGRVRIQKWHERLIDIDILFFESIILSSENLIIPHPFIKERMFVLKPLANVSSGFVHPVYKKTIQQLITECHDDTTINLR